MSSCFSGTSNTVPSDQEHPVATHGESLVNAADGKSCSETTAVSTDDDCYKVMTLDPKDDPQQFHIGRKWLITLTICNTSLCATFVSSVSAATDAGLQRTFHTIHEVTVLSLSLYVLGLSQGPLLFAPLSELYGHNIIYYGSYFLFWVFTWPVAFPPDIETFLVFRFLTGFSSSAFFSVAAGSISDIFHIEEVATPMGMYTLSPFVGPVLGPVVSGFIVQNADYRWAYWVSLIYEFITLVSLLLFVPETYVPVLLKRKAAKLRKETGDDKYWAPLDRHDKSLTESLLMSIYTPFKLILFDRMALSLNLWTALTLGILYLTFEAFPLIFGRQHGFNTQETGLAFLGMGVGLLIALATLGLWNCFDRRMAEKHGGKMPPEAALVRPITHRHCRLSNL